MENVELSIGRGIENTSESLPTQESTVTSFDPSIQNNQILFN